MSVPDKQVKSLRMAQPSDTSSFPVNPEGITMLKNLVKQAKKIFEKQKNTLPELSDQHTRFINFIEALLLDGDGPTIHKLQDKIKEKGISVNLPQRHANSPGLLFLFLRVVKGKIPLPQMPLYIFLLAIFYYPTKTKTALASFYQQTDLMQDQGNPIVAALQIFSDADYPLPHYANELCKGKPSPFRTHRDSAPKEEEENKEEQDDIVEEGQDTLPPKPYTDELFLQELTKETVRGILFPESYKRLGHGLPLTLQYEFLLQFVIECGERLKSIIPDLTLQSSMVKQVVALKWMHIIRYLLSSSRVSQIYEREPKIVPKFQHLNFSSVSELTKLVQMGISLLLSKESVLKGFSALEDYNNILFKAQNTIKHRVEVIERIIIKLRDKYRKDISADLLELIILNVDQGWGSHEDTNLEMQVISRMLYRYRMIQLQKLTIKLLHEGAPIQISQLFRAVRHNAYEFIIEFEFTAGGSVAFKEAHELIDLAVEKMRSNQEAIEIYAFLIHRHLNLLSFASASQFLKNLLVKMRDIQNSFLKKVKNPLKVCVLLQELVQLMMKRFPGLETEVEIVKWGLLQVSKAFEQKITSEQILRSLLQEKDLQRREVIAVIANSEILELFEHEMVQKLGNEAWEGEYIYDHNIMATSTSYFFLSRLALLSNNTPLVTLPNISTYDTNPAKFTFKRFCLKNHPEIKEERESDFERPVSDQVIVQQIGGVQGYSPTPLTHRQHSFYSFVSWWHGAALRYAASFLFFLTFAVACQILVTDYSTLSRKYRSLKVNNLSGVSTTHLDSLLNIYNSGLGFPNDADIRTVTDGPQCAALPSADNFLTTLGLTQEIVTQAGLTTCDILAMPMATLVQTLLGFGFYTAAQANAVAGAIVMQAPLFPVTGCCTFNSCLSFTQTATGYDPTLLAAHFSSLTSCTQVTALKNNYASLSEFLQKGKLVEEARRMCFYALCICLALFPHYVFLYLYFKLIKRKSDIFRENFFIDFVIFGLSIWGLQIMLKYSEIEATRQVLDTNITSVSPFLEYADVASEQWVPLYLALITGALWFRVVYSLRMTELLGSFIKILQLSVAALFTWLNIFLFILLTFALIIGLTYAWQARRTLASGKVTGGCTSVGDCLLLLFSASLGEIEFDQLNDNVFAEILVVLFIVLSLVLLLNILVALLNNTYEDISAKSYRYYQKDVFELEWSWRFDLKFGFLLAFMFPFSVLNIIFFPIIFSFQKCCWQKRERKALPPLKPARTILPENEYDMMNQQVDIPSRRQSYSSLASNNRPKAHKRIQTKNSNDLGQGDNYIQEEEEILLDKVESSTLRDCSQCVVKLGYTIFFLLLLAIFVGLNAVLLIPGYIAALIMLIRTTCKLDPEIFTPNLARFTSNPRFLAIAPKLMYRRKLMQQEIKKQKRRWTCHLLLYLVFGLFIEVFQFIVDILSFIRLMYENQEAPSIGANFNYNKLLKKSIEQPEIYIRQDRLEKIAEIARMVAENQESSNQFVPVLIFIQKLFEVRSVFPQFIKNELKVPRRPNTFKKAEEDSVKEIEEQSVIQDPPRKRESSFSHLSSHGKGTFDRSKTEIVNLKDRHVEVTPDMELEALFEMLKLFSVQQEAFLPKNGNYVDAFSAYHVPYLEKLRRLLLPHSDRVINLNYLATILEMQFVFERSDGHRFARLKQIKMEEMHHHMNQQPQLHHAITTIAIMKQATETVKEVEPLQPIEEPTSNANTLGPLQNPTPQKKESLNSLHSKVEPQQRLISKTSLAEQSDFIKGDQKQKPGSEEGFWGNAEQSVGYFGREIKPKPGEQRNFSMRKLRTYNLEKVVQAIRKYLVLRDSTSIHNAVDRLSSNIYKEVNLKIGLDYQVVKDKRRVNRKESSSRTLSQLHSNL